ncbi:MAG TPA: hypothetical protein VF443_10220, partial [Nitrospira sp.]
GLSPLSVACDGTHRRRRTAHAMTAHMDYTINIMSVVNFGVMLSLGLGGWFAFRSRVDATLLNQRDLMLSLKELMEKLTERFERHEVADAAMFQSLQSAITHLVGDVSRLIGRVESDTPMPMNRRRVDNK